MTVETPRVLLISESRITRRVVEMTLADQPVELVTAASSQEGLAAWSAERARIVLADLTTDAAPDGLAVARRVHAENDGGPVAVILMAGQHEPVDDGAVAAAGVRAVLRKPLDSLHLIDAVRGALRAETSPPPTRPPWPPAEPPMVVDQAAVAGRAAPFDSGATTAPALGDADLERVAARVAAIWSGQSAHEHRVAELVAARAEQAVAASAAAVAERVAPDATMAAAERLVRELAPALVAEVARLVVSDVSERLVREEIARMRAEHVAR